jgi:hypothetical protein
MLAVLFRPFRILEPKGLNYVFFFILCSGNQIVKDKSLYSNIRSPAYVHLVDSIRIKVKQ